MTLLVALAIAGIALLTLYLVIAPLRRPERDSPADGGPADESPAVRPAPTLTAPAPQPARAPRARAASPSSRGPRARPRRRSPEPPSAPALLPAFLLALGILAAPVAGHTAGAQGAPAPSATSGQPATPGPSGAAGTIQGTVIDGTAEAPAPGEPVTLRTLGTARPVPDRSTATDDAGRFAFSGLEEALYQVTATRQGVGFRTPVFALGELSRPVELRVYDVTERDPGLRVERLLLTLEAPDAGRQELGASELLTLVNPGAQAYRPGGPSEPMSLVRFALPPGARGLLPVLGVEPESVVTVDRGFGTATAVPPGAHEFGFSYRFPYRPGTYAFDLAMPYGAQSVRLLVPAGVPLQAAGPDLVALGEVAVAGRLFRAWGAQNVPPGGRLAIELRNLPARPLPQALLQGAARPRTIAGAYAVLLLLGVGWALRGAAGGGTAGTGAPGRHSERAA